MAFFSVLYWLLFLVSLTPLFLGQLAIFLVTAPFDRRRTLVHLFGCFQGMLYVWLNPLWRVKVVGREKLPWHSAAVITANHLSILDILVLYGLFRPFKWVAKGELFRVPFVGWNMRLADYVPIWRGDRESVRTMMARCRAHLDRGVPVLIFPEGTRSLDGEMLPFKEGAFRLACDAGCPVFPVAVSGTGDAIPKHGILFRNPMRARVEVLDPLYPSQFGGDPSALREATRAAIQAALPGGKGILGAAPGPARSRP
jgi:1-acyl-sn-glycerol-3-phosphate acyltransferase